MFALLSVLQFVLCQLCYREHENKSKEGVSKIRSSDKHRKLLHHVLQFKCMMLLNKFLLEANFPQSIVSCRN